MRQFLARQSKGLTEVLDNALHGVGVDGAGEDGKVRPEMAVHPFDQRLAQAAGEVEVDVRQARHVLGDEALQRQVPLERIDVADTDQVADQQGHRRAASTARRSFLQRRFRGREAALLHHLMGDEHDLPIQQQEAGQVVPLDEAHFLFEACLQLRGDGTVAPDGGFEAKLLQVALRGVAHGHVGLGEGVAEVGAQVEGAACGDMCAVGKGLRAIAEQLGHLRRRFQGQVRIGADERQGLVDGQVVFGGDQGILQPVALWGVVMHVVAGNQGDAMLAGQAAEFAVAGGIAAQEVLLQFHVDRAAAVPCQVSAQQARGLLTTAFLHQMREAPAAPAARQHDAFGMRRQMLGVEPRLTTVDGAGQGEQA